MKSRLPPDLISVYRSTDYKVSSPSASFVLRVGVYNAPLASLLASSGHSQAAFITAYNPLGKASKPALNTKALTALKLDLVAMGCALLEGVGLGKDGWDDERGVLALGLRLRKAKALGRKFRQNALVWVGKKAVPRLVLLR